MRPWARYELLTLGLAFSSLALSGCTHEVDIIDVEKDLILNEMRVNQSEISTQTSPWQGRVVARLGGFDGWVRRLNGQEDDIELRIQFQLPSNRVDQRCQVPAECKINLENSNSGFRTSIPVQEGFLEVSQIEGRFWVTAEVGIGGPTSSQLLRMNRVDLMRLDR